MSLIPPPAPSTTINLAVAQIGVGMYMLIAQPAGYPVPMLQLVLDRQAITYLLLEFRKILGIIEPSNGQMNAL